jgi:hypothetical protein
VETPHEAASVLPPKALSDPAVGEAHAYVQGESLKACAAFLVRLSNSPITKGEERIAILGWFFTIMFAISAT